MTGHDFIIHLVYFLALTVNIIMNGQEIKEINNKLDSCHPGVSRIDAHLEKTQDYNKLQEVK